MASTTEIVNAALTLLGEARVLSIDDNTKPAREAKAIYEIARRSLMSSYDWSFAKARAQLPALADAPAFGYSYAYQIPTDCLRLVRVGDFYMGADLTDYRGAPTEEFTIEGRQILTDEGSPLNVVYISDVDSPSVFSAPFVACFAADLAQKLAEPLTQSESKRDMAMAAFKDALRSAIRANAIELPPSKLADDEWVLSRI